MPNIQFKKLLTDDGDTMGLQQNTIDAFNNFIVANPILYGNLLKDVVLAHPTLNLIEHKLGRLPQGYIIVDRNADANIYSATTKPLPLRFLYLYATAPVTVTIWVF